MAKDSDVLKEVWEGYIAARFTLASHEISSSGKPTPQYLMLQRSSYLPLVNDKIKKHFTSFIHENSGDEIWFDYNGQPLRWHYPIGVLFDIICGDSPQVPLDITVHFQDFPEVNIMKSSQPEMVEAQYMSMLKEADQLKHRGQVINNMNKNQHKQLWHSLRNNNFDQFWSVNRKLMEGFEGSQTFKYIPVRVYIDEHVYQQLITPMHDDHETATKLEHCIAEVLEYFSLGSRPDEICAIIQGIVTQHHMPMQWLSEHLSCADNFLHVVLTKSSKDV